ncbi:MAG: 4Fe-4S dicluster domain-containing protein [Lentisphaerota bacterium]
MLKTVLARLHQKHRTIKYPKAPPPPLPDRFRGRLCVQPNLCPSDCKACVEICPVQALARTGATAPSVDLGRCLFCGECAAACPQKAITFDSGHSLSTSRREHLVLAPGQTLELACTMRAEIHRFLGRSLKLRQVSAGGCNACEADVNVLGTVGWDLGRFGIQFVASPRHADGLLITGPVTQNMQFALMETYRAVPDPKIVIVVGACAIAGGPCLGHPEVNNGAGGLLPVDLFIPGCPPHPLTILDGLLRLLGRLPNPTVK